MTTPNLPVELYPQIIDHLDPSDDRLTLISLLLSSKAIFPDAERLLYHLFNRKDARSQFLFYQRVTSCDRVARLVIKFGPRLTDVSWDDEEYWALFTRAISSLINVRYLSFRSAANEVTTHVLNGPFKLRYLDWGWSRVYDDQLCRFLCDQPGLEFAAFMGGFDRQAFPKTALPRLVHFGGNYLAIRAVLPGRQVTRLHWTPDSGEAFRDMDISPGLASALQALRVLIYGGNFKPRPLHSITDHLMNLVTLVLVGEWDELSKCVGELKNLKFVYLTVQWRDPQPVTDEYMKATVTSILDASETVEAVFVIRNLGDKHHLKWKRGGDADEPETGGGPTTKEEDETRGMYRQSWLAYLARL